MFPSFGSIEEKSVRHLALYNKMFPSFGSIEEKCPSFGSI